MEECMFQDEEDENQMHKCELGLCENIVPFDDEPYCYQHSPNSGSVLIGYSYKRSHQVA
jgi:hypothetical protein